MIIISWEGGHNIPYRVSTLQELQKGIKQEGQHGEELINFHKGLSEQLDAALELKENQRWACSFVYAMVLIALTASSTVCCRYLSVY